MPHQLLQFGRHQPPRPPKTERPPQVMSTRVGCLFLGPIRDDTSSLADVRYMRPHGMTGAGDRFPRLWSRAETQSPLRWLSGTLSSSSAKSGVIGKSRLASTLLSLGRNPEHGIPAGVSPPQYNRRRIPSQRQGLFQPQAGCP